MSDSGETPSREQSHSAFLQERANRLRSRIASGNRKLARTLRRLEGSDTGASGSYSPSSESSTRSLSTARGDNRAYAADFFEMATSESSASVLPALGA